MIIAEEMLRRLKTLVNVSVFENDPSCLEQAPHLLRHEFNVLGSGWVANRYGMQTKGFQGFNYSDPTIRCEDIRASVPDSYQARQRRQLELLAHYAPDYCPIDWQIDIKSGARYSIAHISNITFGKIEGMDAKMPSDLSRWYHLVMLARVWRLTGEDIYRTEVIAQILDWLTVHPYEYGAGWRANMNVSIRVVNGLTALSLIADSLNADDPYDRAFLDELYDSLQEHRRYISKYLEFTEAPSCLHPNHYLADLSGLLVLSTFLKGIDPDAEAWQLLSKRELALTLRWQINGDGFDFESTTMYHAFATEMVTGALLLSARLEGANTPAEITAQLRKGFGEELLTILRSMYAALRDIIQPNRGIPVVGDNDSGRFLYLEKTGGCDTDRVFLCGAGAALFGDETLLPAVFTAEDWQYASALMTHGMCKTLPAPDAGVKSAAFAESGFFVMKSPTAYAFVSCAQIGTAGKGAHSHNDRLAVTLSVKGTDLIIDPGVYAYTASMKYRNLYRDVSAHSTVCIAGTQPNRLNPEGCWWGYRDDTRCECLWFEQDGERTVFIGKHHAYERLDVPVTHIRRAELTGSSLTLHDDFVKDVRYGNEMSVEYYFTLGADCTVKADGSRVTVTANGTTVHAETANGSWIVEEGFYAPMYGKNEATTRLRIRFESFITENDVRFSW